MHPAVAALSLEEKGFVLGAILARRAPEAALAGLGASGARCGAAIEALTAAPKATRASALAALIALARARIPAGLERIHPDWLRERLERESSAVVRAVAEGLPPEVRAIAADVLGRRGEAPSAVAPVGDAARVAELGRIVFAGLVPLAGPGAPPGPGAQALLALSPRALVEAIEARGAEMLGTSLRGAPGPVVARAAAALGDRLAGAVVGAAAAIGTPEARERARRLVASAGAQAPRETAWALGVRALADELVDEGLSALVAVAQRLPPARGRHLLEATGAEAAP